MKKIFLLLLIVLFAVSGCAPQVAEKEESDVFGDGLEIHFLDVGQADCALVICNGETMLIDGGNVSDSSFIYSYLERNFIDTLDYVVLSHAHEDHVGGLPAALRHSDAGRVFAPEAESDAKCYRDFIDAVKEQGLSVENPQVGDVFELGGSEVEILSSGVSETEELNNTSLILKITYGDVSVLFSGDAEYDAEKALLAAGADVESTVLKSPHHGSDTSSCYEFLRSVNPEYIVISVGHDNSYGHPHSGVISRYEALDAKVYRTDVHGTVILKSDGYSVNFKTEKTEKENKDSVGTTEKIYIGNKNSGVYHSPSCNALPKEKNRVFFDSKEMAEAEKYRPCSNCLN